MTTKRKTRKASAAKSADPVFAAIAEHKVLVKESNRLEKSCETARDKAERKYGEWIRTPKPGEWQGEAIITPFYDRWNRAGRAERKAGMRMARTQPTTVAGAAALVAYTQRDIVENFNSDLSDWCTIALKTAAAALTRIGAEAA